MRACSQYALRANLKPTRFGGSPVLSASRITSWVASPATPTEMLLHGLVLTIA